MVMYSALGNDLQRDMFLEGKSVFVERKEFAQACTDTSIMNKY